jgi:hypothetical protein
MDEGKGVAFDKEWWFAYQKQLTDHLLDVTHKKNNDYTGGKTASNPFANFDASVDFGIEPIVGVCLRMSDKFQRAKAFAHDGKLAYSGSNDSVKDIFLDIAGYSLIVLGMLERMEKQSLTNSEEQMS